MGKGGRKARVKECSSSDEVGWKRKPPDGTASSDDDDEANGDLSLEIVRRSILRTANNDLQNDGVFENVSGLKEDGKKRDLNKKERSKDVVETVSNLNGTVTSLDEEEERIEEQGKGAGVKFMNDDMPETEKATVTTVNAVETILVGTADNIVLRKLLRGPRYFDPPDSIWGTCYNCGEEGHTTVNCTVARRKKPCFVCGSFEHNAKQCTKSRDCFICKQQGHRAKDCPDKLKSSRICLKCGDSGHDMFSCKNDYCPDDLKEIQCYICGSFGHLCCKTYADPGPRVPSCYRCGLSGHIGLACTVQHGERNVGASTNSCYRCGLEGHFARECSNSAKLGDRNDNSYANSCYKCGLEGHFARECTNSAKSGKRYRDPSIPKQQSSKKKKDHKERSLSVPNDVGKTRKKKYQYQEYTPVAKTKHGGGWITEDPGYYYNNKMESDNWRSPATPNSRRPKFSSSDGNYTSISDSNKKSHKINFNDSASNGSNRSHHFRVSASRFGSSNKMSGRSYDWW